MRTLHSVILASALLSAIGCGRSAEVEPLDRAQFVRGGLVVPAGWAASGALVIRADNAATALAEAQPLAAGTFFAFAWEPGARYVVETPAGRVECPSPMRPEPAVVARVALESVHAGSVTAGGEPDAALAFSDDGSLLALGTFGGYVRVFETETGRCVFEKHLAGAVVKRVAISADSSRVYAGEMSPDGFVRAFDIATKQELWRFRLADELGMSKPARGDDFFALYAYPQAYAMRAIGDDLLVDGFHSWNDAGSPRHLSRLYRLSGSSGLPRWRFPAGAPLARNITWFESDARTVAFTAYQWERPDPADNVPQAALYLVDIERGAPLGLRAFEPLKPFFDTTPMWYGLAGDGAGHLAVGLMDGRGAIFATRGQEGTVPDNGTVPRLVRELDLATPVEVTGVPIYAGAGWAAGAGGTLFLLTDGRLVAPSAGAQGKSVRADHFNSNTLFAFDGATGRLLWQWKLANTAQGVAAGQGVVAVSTQQSYSADDPLDYGITVFDTERGGRPRAENGDSPIQRDSPHSAGQSPFSPVEKMLFRYPTAGPIVALAVSLDGSRIAAVEAPVRLADGLTVVGEYRLHIIR